MPYSKKHSSCITTKYLSLRNDLDIVLTQVVLVTVAGLIGVWEAGVEGSSLVIFDLFLDSLGHLCNFQTEI